MHGRIRLADQLLRRRGRLGERYADADGDSRLFAFEFDRLMEDRDDPIGEFHHCVPVLHAGDEDGELVTTDTGHRVPWANHRLQQGTDLHQHRVADAHNRGCR